MASLVWGITHTSSAATTRTTRSVAQPRCQRIAGKGLVTRGVEEGNHATIGFHVVGTNMLRDAAGFACGDLWRDGWPVEHYFSEMQITVDEVFKRINKENNQMKPTFQVGNYT